MPPMPPILEHQFLVVRLLFIVEQCLEIQPAIFFFPRSHSILAQVAQHRVRAGQLRSITNFQWPCGCPDSPNGSHGRNHPRTEQQYSDANSFEHEMLHQSAWPNFALHRPPHAASMTQYACFSTLYFCPACFSVCGVGSSLCFPSFGECHLMHMASPICLPSRITVSLPNFIK